MTEIEAYGLQGRTMPTVGDKIGKIDDVYEDAASRMGARQHRPVGTKTSP
jgi:hypothetical protein